jgi:hypothetical protein
MKSKSRMCKEKYGFMPCNWLVTYVTETFVQEERRQRETSYLVVKHNKKGMQKHKEHVK